MNTKKYYRPEVEILEIATENCFAASQGGSEKEQEYPGDLEFPDFEIW